MKKLPDKLTNEQVEELVEAGRVEFDRYLHNSKFFAIIDKDNLYGNTGSYEIITRDYRKRVAEIKGDLK